ncbi:tetratricopeptide repeat protein [Streptomyces sp. NPDC086838]|uniref:tetratricopeptide repeat protein n=1 Tax=Streptomyces sp. NPDC086838 TaxID=3365762 RepID=UPI00381240D5
MPLFGASIEIRDSLVQENFDVAPSRPGYVRAGDESFSRTPASARARGASGDLYGQWLAAARVAAGKARMASERAGNAPVALARLAQAELSAGMENEAKKSAETVLLRSLETYREHGEGAVDLAACYAASKVLIALHVADMATSFLQELPSAPSLLKLRAELAVDAKDFATALEIIEPLESSDAQSLRGYIYMMTGDYASALRSLRAAAREFPNDADIAMNMALAYRNLGSLKKSLKMVYRASRISPGRKDVSLGLIGELIHMGSLKGAETEIKRLKASGVIESADFLMMQARLQGALGNESKVLIFLRKAAHQARTEGSAEIEAEVDAHLALARLSIGEISREEAQAVILSGLSQAPDSLGLTLMYADVCDDIRASEVIAERLRRHRRNYPGANLKAIESRLAFLELRFEDSARLIQEWAESRPGDAESASHAVILTGQATGDWQVAADLARRFFREGRESAGLRNNAAYVMAFSGAANEAAGILSLVEDDSFIIRATRGLVLIARGEFESGMRLYRDAAGSLDSHSNGETYRCLMAVHQGIALRAFGVVGTVSPVELKALSLPASLPKGWEHKVSLRVLQHICDVHGYPWPPIID